MKNMRGKRMLHIRYLIDVDTPGNTKNGMTDGTGWDQNFAFVTPEKYGIQKKIGQFLRRISEVHAFCEDGSRKITTNHFEEYLMMRLNTAVEGVPLPQFVSE